MIIVVFIFFVAITLIVVDILLFIVVVIVESECIPSLIEASGQHGSLVVGLKLLWPLLMLLLLGLQVLYESLQLFLSESLEDIKPKHIRVEGANAIGAREATNWER